MNHTSLGLLFKSLLIIHCEFEIQSVKFKMNNENFQINFNKYLLETEVNSQSFNMKVWYELPFKNGLDGIICSKSERWLKKLTPMQSKFKTAILIQKYHKLKKVPHQDSILFSEREYNYLTHVLSEGDKQQQVFRNTFEEKNTIIIIYRNKKIGGYDIYQLTNGNDRFLRLTGRETSKLLKDYKILTDFVDYGQDEVD